MKVSTENDNNFGYEKISIVVDIMPLHATTPMHDSFLDIIMDVLLTFDLLFFFLTVQHLLM
jgi:hypothetical protein